MYIYLFQYDGHMEANPEEVESAGFYGKEEIEKLLNENSQMFRADFPKVYAYVKDVLFS